MKDCIGHTADSYERLLTGVRMGNLKAAIGESAAPAR